MRNFATKELKHATGVETFDLAVKDFVALKAEVDKLDINKLVNVPTSLNNFKKNVDDLDAVKLKTAPVDMKKRCSGSWSCQKQNLTYEKQK